MGAGATACIGTAAQANRAALADAGSAIRTGVVTL